MSLIFSIMVQTRNETSYGWRSRTTDSSKLCYQGKAFQTRYRVLSGQIRQFFQNAQNVRLRTQVVSRPVSLITVFGFYNQQTVRPQAYRGASSEVVIRLRVTPRDPIR